MPVQEADSLLQLGRDRPFALVQGHCHPAQLPSQLPSLRDVTAGTGAYYTPLGREGGLRTEGPIQGAVHAGC